MTNVWVVRCVVVFCWCFVGIVGLFAHSYIVQGAPLPPHHRFARVEPLDARVPWVMVSTDDCPEDFKACPSDHAFELFAVKIVDWAVQGRFPRGRIVTRFGAVGDIEAETAALLHVRCGSLLGIASVAASSR